jgi:hypothetical protein
VEGETGRFGVRDRVIRASDRGLYSVREVNGMRARVRCFGTVARGCSVKTARCRVLGYTKSREPKYVAGALNQYGASRAFRRLWSRAQRDERTCVGW